MISFLIAIAIGQSAIRVACVGASITEGVGTSNPKVTGYPSQMGMILGSNYVIGNFGNSGSTMTKSTDHPYWNTPQFKASQAFAPNIVIIQLGTNDATLARWPKVKDEFVPAYKEMVRLYQNLPSHPKVYACVPPPAWDERKPQIDTAVAPLVRQAAREAGIQTIDLYSVLDGKADLFPDKLHPNDEGAKILAETVAEAVEDPAIRKGRWKLVSFDSEEDGEGQAKAAIDGDPYTYWHTNYSIHETRPPHTLVVDMGESAEFKAFRYLPRQDGGVNGRVKDFELYLSDSPSEWGEPIAKGAFKDTAQATRIDFTPARGRYFKFVALSEQQKQAWSSVAELDLIKKR